MSGHEQEAQHISPVKVYVAIWLALVGLTVITVSVGYLNMQKFTVFTAMLIATIKVTLVLLYFMHIRFEKAVYTYMILAVLATYGIFITLTFADYSFR
jgi:cytochrome c oxidase subunit 4